MEEVPGNAAVPVNRTVIPNETLLAILRWLHRFDLDGVQIITKRLRSLVENNEMPLRLLDEVTYIGDAGEGDSVLSKNILLLQPNDYMRRKEQCPLDVVGGIDVARRYLTTAFIRTLVVSDHRERLPNRELLTATEEHINCLSFERCSFSVGERRRRLPGGRWETSENVVRENALEKTLHGCHFAQLYVEDSSLPGWQVNDDLLYEIGSAGCVLVDFTATLYQECALTDDGILDYCFSSDLGAMKDRGRTLYVKGASITPALPEECVQASLESEVTGQVQLAIWLTDHDLIFSDCLAAFVENCIDVSTGPFGEESRIYDFPDEGNGMRLQIRLVRRHWSWSMQMRRGNKDDTAFFESAFEDM